MTAPPPLDPVLQVRIEAAVRAMLPEIVAQVEAAISGRQHAEAEETRRVAAEHFATLRADPLWQERLRRSEAQRERFAEMRARVDAQKARWRADAAARRGGVP